MSIDKSKREKSRRPTVDFLSQLENNIENLDGVDDKISERFSRGKGSRKVSFNSTIHQRRFDKNHSVMEFDEDAQAADEDMNVEADKYGEDDNIAVFDDGSDNEGVDFDALSPAEQLKMLMERVDDDEYEDEDEDEFDEDELDEDEPDENDQVDDNRSSKKIRLSLDDDDDDDDKGEERIKSTFEKQQEKLKKKISELEEESIGERPWMLKGEVTAKHRPVNSLLEQDLDFEHASRPAPVITEEATESIEVIIRQRIKDRAWDDVERKEESSLRSTTNQRKLPELDGEKSKKSLSEIYEEEYTSSKSVSSPPEKLVDEATQKAHDEISDLFKKICQKIDSLSSYKFAPRTYSLDEINIKTLKGGKKQATSINKV